MILKRATLAALGIPFAILGYETAIDPGPRVPATEKLGIPYAKQAVQLDGALMALGGAALTLNVVPRIGALTVAATLVPTTIAGHPFWKFKDKGERAGQRTQFLKNLGLLGGMLAIACLPANKK